MQPDVRRGLRRRLRDDRGLGRLRRGLGCSRCTCRSRAGRTACRDGRSRRRRWHPIFSVGPGSGFYSPFWQMIYVEVPDGTPSATLTSVRQILDGGYPLQPGRGGRSALVPGRRDAGATPRERSGRAATGAAGSTARRRRSSTFRQAPFTWDDDRRRSTRCRSTTSCSRRRDGTLVAPRRPDGARDRAARIRSTPAARRQPGQPTATYSAYWRLYTVDVPADGARVRAAGDGGRHGAERRGPAGRRPSYASDAAITAVPRLDRGRRARPRRARRADLLRRRPMPTRRGTTRAAGSTRRRAIETNIDRERDRADRHHRHLSARQRRTDAGGPLMSAASFALASRAVRSSLRRRVAGARAGAAAAEPAPDGEPGADQRQRRLHAAARGQRRAAPLSINGYVDVGFAKAQGDGTSFAPGDTRVPARLRRRHASRRR